MAKKDQEIALKLILSSDGAFKDIKKLKKELLDIKTQDTILELMVNNIDAVEKIKNQKTRIEELKKEQTDWYKLLKVGKISETEYAKQIQVNAFEIGKNKQVISELNKEIKNNQKTINTLETDVYRLTEKLSRCKKQYSELSEEQKKINSR